MFCINQFDPDLFIAASKCVAKFERDFFRSLPILHIWHRGQKKQAAAAARVGAHKKRHLKKPTEQTFLPSVFLSPLSHTLSLSFSPSSSFTLSCILSQSVRSGANAGHLCECRKIHFISYFSLSISLLRTSLFSFSSIFSSPDA